MQEILDKIQLEIESYFGEGKVADYIPELAKIDPKQFAMTVRTIDGQEFSTGDYTKKFSIQSISKVFILTMAMRYLDKKLWTRVGKEPSGTPFNSLIQLESEHGIPRNPFINSGALVTTDIILNSGNDALKDIVNFVRTLSGNTKIDYDYEVANSEFEHSDRNAALTHFMKSFGNIDSNIEDLLDVYCHHCSLALSTQDLTRAFMYLANNGTNPSTGDTIISPLETKRINALMMTCGLYDNVGEFAYQVGLPGKSGVGGGIIAVLPRKYVVSVWSPALNKSGNSLIGTKALQLFTEYSEDSIF